MRAFCPICSAEKEFKLVFETPSIRARASFSIGACETCQVQKVLNVPANLDAYYENTHMRKELNKIHAHLKHFLLSMEASRFSKGIDPSRTFVDIGCGVGDFSHLLYKNGLPVIAVDSGTEKPPDIRTNTKIPYYRIDYQSYQIHGMPKLKKGTAILRHVLEHTQEPDKFLLNLMDYGIDEFYIVVPDHGSIQNKLFRQYNYFYDPPLHLWFFTHATIQKLLQRLNMNIAQEGYDTIPNIASSFYRFLLIKGCPRTLCEFLRPQSVVNSLSGVLDILLPRNVTWCLSKTKNI